MSRYQEIADAVTARPAMSAPGVAAADCFMVTRTERDALLAEVDRLSTENKAARRALRSVGGSFPGDKDEIARLSTERDRLAHALQGCVAKLDEFPVAWHSENARAAARAVLAEIGAE